MTENVENLMLEHLRDMRASIDRMGESLNVKTAVRTQKKPFVLSQSKPGRFFLRSPIGLENRVERVEKRLELVG